MAGRIVQAGQALGAHALLNCTITASESRGRGAFSSSNRRPSSLVSMPRMQTVGQLCVL